MGQQQLILLALAVIIVGGAIVVGIRAFSENNIKNNVDVMMQDAVRVANDLQAWKQKPAPFGGQASCAGGGDPSDPNDFLCATWGLLGYGAVGATYTNLNGKFQLTSLTADQAIITGSNTALNNSITVTVTGLADTTIAGSIVCLGGKIPTSGGACTAPVF